MIQTYKTTLTDKRQLTEDVFIFSFRLNNLQEIIFKAGQYVILMVPCEASPSAREIGETKRRLYSILSTPASKNSFDLLIQLVPGGCASEYLKNLAINDKVIFQGPAGMFTFKNTSANNIFFATGTGIAPIKSIIEDLLSQKLQITNYKLQILLLWGLKFYKDIYLFEELKALSKRYPHQFTFKICLSREKDLSSIGEKDQKYFSLGRVTGEIEKDTFSPNNLPAGRQGLLLTTDYYLCGGKEVVESLRNFLAEKQIAKENVHFEKFT